MGLLDGLGNIVGGVLTLNPGKVGEGVADVVKTPFDMAQSALVSRDSNSLTGGGGMGLNSSSLNALSGSDSSGQF